jgi:hypothetical protein
MSPNGIEAMLVGKKKEDVWLHVGGALASPGSATSFLRCSFTGKKDSSQVRISGEAFIAFAVESMVA